MKLRAVGTLAPTGGRVMQSDHATLWTIWIAPTVRTGPFEVGRCRRGLGSRRTVTESVPLTGVGSWLFRMWMEGKNALDGTTPLITTDLRLDELHWDGASGGAMTVPTALGSA